MSDAPVPTTPKRTLSVLGFVFGLVGFVSSLIPLIGFPASVAGIVLSLVGKSKEPGAPKWMWIVGLIAGILGLLGSITWGIVGALLAVAAQSGGITVN